MNRSRFFKLIDSAFLVISFIIILLIFSFIFAIVYDIFRDGFERLSLKFLLSYPSRKPERAGILPAWVGSLALISVAVPFSALFGVLAGIYLEEYAPKNTLTKIIEININNLSAVPSIVYGLLAVGIFAQIFGFGESILTGGLTLGVLMLPIVVVSTREAIRSVPLHLREAVYALGGTKFEVLKDHVLPYAKSGILTGVVIGVSRALGETAPLITIGALTFIAFLPPSPIKSEFPFISFDWLSSPFTVLPIQIFNWVSRPQEEFHKNAAAAGLILLVLNTILIILLTYMRFKGRVQKGGL